MGYTTDFSGVFKLNEKLDQELYDFLVKFSDTRRMIRKIDGYGIEGEFYVGDDQRTIRDGGNIIEFNTPPRTQPGLWCQWIPTDDGLGIEWDGNEKFYNYVEWLNYIILNFLQPNEYVLNGTVVWEGESEDDEGRIIVTDNKIRIDSIDVNESRAAIIDYVEDLDTKMITLYVFTSLANSDLENILFSFLRKYYYDSLIGNFLISFEDKQFEPEKWQMMASKLVKQIDIGSMSKETFFEQFKKEFTPIKMNDDGTSIITFYLQ